MTRSQPWMDLLKIKSGTWNKHQILVKMSFKQLVQVPKILVGHFQSNYWISFNRHLENQLVGGQ